MRVFSLFFSLSHYNPPILSNNWYTRNDSGLKIVHGDSYIIIKNKINKQSRNLQGIKVMISRYFSDEF